jgi:hypothetical protein
MTPRSIGNCRDLIAGRTLLARIATRSGQT